MRANKPLDRDAAKQRPESVFGSPLDIAKHQLLTKGEKLATLERWRQSILEQLAAAGEGMPTYGVSAGKLKVLEEIEVARQGLA